MSPSISLCNCEFSDYSIAPLASWAPHRYMHHAVDAEACGLPWAHPNAFPSRESASGTARSITSRRRRVSCRAESPRDFGLACDAIAAPAVIAVHGRVSTSRDYLRPLRWQWPCVQAAERCGQSAGWSQGTAAAAWPWPCSLGTDPHPRPCTCRASAHRPLRSRATMPSKNRKRMSRPRPITLVPTPTLPPLAVLSQRRTRGCLSIVARMTNLPATDDKPASAVRRRRAPRVQDPLMCRTRPTRPRRWLNRWPRHEPLPQNAPPSRPSIDCEAVHAAAVRAIPECWVRCVFPATAYAQLQVRAPPPPPSLTCGLARRTLPLPDRS
eukprot:358784-Chlamydomonas_euryale.AAC.5